MRIGEVLTMAEYIKREYAIDAVLDVYYNTPDINLSGEKFEAASRKSQAADVAPLRHGRWLPFHSTAAGDIQYCSACEIGCTWKPNYCPNCGCKMDLEG